MTETMFAADVSALDGADPFKKPIKDLRPIAYLYNWSPFQLLLTKDFAESHGIKTFEDIIKKNMAVSADLLNIRARFKANASGKGKGPGKG